MLRCIATSSSTTISWSGASTRSFSSSVLRQAKTSEAKKAEQRSRDILKKKKTQDALSLEEAARVLQAVEVGSPRSAYEINVLTHYAKGSAAPRGRVSLPHDPRTTEERILVFADGKHAEAATKLGVAYVGGEELINDVLEEKILPTKVLCIPSLLPRINAKLARFLGPKGLMPAARRGTVTEDIPGAIRAISGTVDWKGDKEGIVRIPIGRLHFSKQELERNVRAFVDHIKTSTGPKDDLFAKKKSNIPPVIRVFLSSTRGPGIPLLDV